MVWARLETPQPLHESKPVDISPEGSSMFRMQEK
jgi:hypothetical protein